MGLIYNYKFTITNYNNYSRFFCFFSLSRCCNCGPMYGDWKNERKSVEWLVK